MKLVALISSGIDSPVAAYMMSRMGAEVILLHMDNRPFADDDSLDRVMDLRNALNAATGTDMPLYSAPHGASQKRISETCDSNYQCVMCKRVMQRTAREFGKEHGCSGIIMGDSLGQVASQTLKNIRSENLGLDFPVVRPLIGYDKLEIEAIAKRIGTYEISVRPTIGCRMVPVKPITESDVEKIKVFDAASDLESLIAYASDNAVRL